MRLDPRRLHAEAYRKFRTKPEGELLELLREGEPRERVWSAWALGERRGEEAAPVVREALAEEPHAGVRRHFLVMLAGWGDVDVVTALSRHDPDDYVRATATQYVAILSKTHPELLGVLDERFADATPRVRAAAVTFVSADASGGLGDRLRSALDDPAAVVRHAAVRRLATDVEGSTQEWARAYFDAPTAVLRRAILERWTARAGLSDDLFEAFKEQGALLELFDALRQAGRLGEVSPAARVGALRAFDASEPGWLPVLEALYRDLDDVAPAEREVLFRVLAELRPRAVLRRGAITEYREEGPAERVVWAPEDYLLRLIEQLEH